MRVSNTPKNPNIGELSSPNQPSIEVKSILALLDTRRAGLLKMD